MKLVAKVLRLVPTVYLAGCGIADAASEIPYAVRTDLNEEMKACDGKTVQERGLITSRSVRGLGTGPVYILNLIHLRCVIDGVNGGKPVAFWCGSIGCQTMLFVREGSYYIKTEITGDPEFSRRGRKIYLTYYEKNAGAEPLTFVWRDHEFSRSFPAPRRHRARP